MKTNTKITPQATLSGKHGCFFSELLPIISDSASTRRLMGSILLAVFSVTQIIGSSTVFAAPADVNAALAQIRQVDPGLPSSPTQKGTFWTVLAEIFYSASDGPALEWKIKAQYLETGSSVTLSTLSSAGTLNYISKYTGSGNTIGNSLLYDNGTNVGIGTASPGAKLDVVGAIRTNNQFISTVGIGTAPFAVTSTTVVTNLNADLLDGISSASFAQLASPTFTGTPTAPTAALATNTTQIATTAFVKNQGYITAASETDPQVGSNTTNYVSKWNGTALVTGLIFDNGTNVGIGTVTPGYTLDVNGVINATSFRGDGSSLTNVAASSVTWAGITGKPTTLAGYGITDAQGLIAAGTTAQYYRWDKTWQTLDKTAVGLANVDNTSDAAKPVSTATQTALNLKANLASPALTGTPTAPTAATATNTTQIATTAFVKAQGYVTSTSETDPQIGTITMNYIPKWDGSALVTGQLFDNGTNIGIGTATPGAKLDLVWGDARVNGITIGLGSGSIADNTVIGISALASNTTWASNTAIGYFALTANTAWSSNTANGYRALGSNTTGGRNTALGYMSLSSNTTGNDNTAIGTSVLSSNTTGIRNTAVGFQSLIANTTGGSNTAHGYLTLASNTTGGSNTAIWQEALSFNTTGGSNTANGYQSLYQNTTGLRNTAVGFGSLAYNTTANDNTANGYQSLYLNSTGYNNTALGMQTLYSNTTGYENAAVGYLALYNNTAWVGNTTLGQRAGFTITTGSSNIAIGQNAQVASATWSNQLSIGNWIYGTNGDIGIGTSTPGYKLDVNGTVNATTFRGNGSLLTNLAWASITGKPTTLWAWGYGVTDFISSTSANPVAADTTTNGHYYVNSNIALFGQGDGALYVQGHSPSWAGQIFQDYRTGQIALRGKNNGTWQAWRTNLDSGNYSTYAPTLTGGWASGTWGINITGNSATATAFSTTRLNYMWATNNSVTGQMMWKNYGNNHTIFDASAGTSPDGTAVNNTNADIAWTGTYPTLMGWNGANTYGVRVDSARVADNSSSLGGIAAASYAQLASPALTGTPTAPTQLTADNSTALATTAFVKAQGYITTASETDPQVGTNATSYIPRFNGTALVTGSVFDNGTNIGIGTATPSTKLHIEAANVAITDGVPGKNTLTLTTNSPQNIDVGASIGLGGITTGTTKRTFGVIAARKENGTDSNGSWYMAFYTHKHVTGLVERVRIDSDGKVGVGTQTPTTKFEVADNLNSVVTQRVSNANAGATAGSAFQLASATANSNVTALLSENSGAPYYRLEAGAGVQNAYFRLPNYNFQSNTGVTQLTIDNAGNVGIPTVNTSYKVNVTGSVNATSLCLSGSCATSWNSVSGLAGANESPIFTQTLYGLGSDSAARTGSATAVTLKTFTAPFASAAAPACPAGKSKTFKVNFTYTDNLTTGGQSTTVLFDFTAGTDRNITLPFSNLPETQNRSFMTSEFAETNTANAALKLSIVGGVSGSYTQLEQIDILHFCR